VERVKAGLRNARAKGKKLGRPRVKVDESRVKAFRDSGASWRSISRQMELSLSTVRRASQRSEESSSQATSQVGPEVLYAP
jgi:DNA invertase Pin-like site-specific DNA recombinase